MRKRCQLCGGKLVDNICTECGLDNSKNDSNYVTNQYRCEDEPLTHVHSSSEDAYSGKTMTKEQSQKIRGEKKETKKDKRKDGQSKKPKKKISSVKIIKIVIVVSLLWALFSGLFSFVTSLFQSDSDYGTEEDYDPYWNEQTEIPVDGENFTTDIGSGYYKGGIHIPEGVYTVEVVNGTGGFSLKDWDNSIFQYFSSDEVSEKMEDVRIHNGALITVNANVVLRFTTQNAQPLLETVLNENTETVTLTPGKELVGGVDLPVGSYDVVCVEGEGSFVYEYIDWDNQTYEDSIDMDAEGTYSVDQFANLVIQDGQKIAISSDSAITINLVPSTVVSAEGYDDYYDDL